MQARGCACGPPISCCPASRITAEDEGHLRWKNGSAESDRRVERETVQQKYRVAKKTENKLGRSRLVALPAYVAVSESAKTQNLPPRGKRFCLCGLELKV